MSQEEVWSGGFGKEYTDRNIFSVEEADDFYVKTFGVSRRALNSEFLGGRIEKSARILEVGCNVGVQLLVLQSMGYSDLWGIELQDYAVEKAKEMSRGMNIVKSSAFDIPFKDAYFDLVFTSGVLIHISPDNIGRALDEIYRCSRSYIWGFEYYAPSGYEMIKYRGKENLMWKTNFPKLFLDRFPGLELVCERVVDYKDNDNQDVMYLLKKPGKVE